jgi:hypothetical protein
MVHRNPGMSKGFTVVELIGYELFEALKRAGALQSADLEATALIVRGLDQIRQDLLHAVPRTESREPVFVGRSPDPDKSVEATELLKFYSLCMGQGDGRFSSLRHMCHVRYVLVRTKGSMDLYRSAVPVVGPGSTMGDGGRDRILDRVQRLKIAVREARTWAPSFSSDKRPPAGVELMVTACGRTWPLSIGLPCGVSEAQP